MFRAEPPSVAAQRDDDSAPQSENMPRAAQDPDARTGQSVMNIKSVSSPTLPTAAGSGGRPPTAIRLPAGNGGSSAASEATETAAQTIKEAAGGDAQAVRKLAAASAASKAVPPPGTGKLVRATG